MSILRRLAGLLAATSMVLVAAVGVPSFATAAEPPRVKAVSVHDGVACAIHGDGTIGCWGPGLEQDLDIGWAPAPPPAGTFTRISVGVFDACAIRTDGVLVCWPLTPWDPVEAPAGTFVDVSGSCGLQADGTLTCWREFGSGRRTPPTGAYASMHAGDRHACAVSASGAVVCWGEYFQGQATPAPGTYTAVTVGWTHSCGIRTDGSVACWGTNEYGEAAPPPGTFTQISAGARHTCGLRSDQTVECWGLGDEGETTSPAGTFTSVAAAAFMTCAIRTDDTVDCWGESSRAFMPPRPTAIVDRLPRWRATTTVAAGWSALPALADISSYDVRVRRATSTAKGFGDWAPWANATTSTTGTLVGRPGRTYCLAVRARDASDTASRWTGATCTAVPLDDRALTPHGHWQRSRNDAFYRGTALRSSTSGDRLSLGRVVGRGFALVATTCPSCGNVEVYLDSKLLKVVSLYSATRTDRQVIRLKHSWMVRSGSLDVRVVSSGKRIIIDGLAVTQD